MEKFTKGKWLFSNNKGHYFAGASSVQKEDGSATIAIVYGATKEEQDANANLISCAPEMYDLLKRAQEFFAGYDSPLEREIKELLNKINS